jgi:hypothetical protein
MTTTLTFEDIEAAFDALHAAAHEFDMREEERALRKACREAAEPLGRWLAEHACGAVYRDSAGEPRVPVPMSVVMATITELRRHAQHLAALGQWMPAGQTREIVAQLEGGFIAATQKTEEPHE